MKKLMSRLTYIVIALLFSTITLSAIADSPAPVAQCQSYLMMSDTAFTQALQNKNMAGVISNALNSCEKYNACAQIDGVDHCSAILFNRGFDSTLAFNSADNGNSALGSAFTSTNNNAAVNNSNQTEAAAPTSINNDTENNNVNKPHTESINWF